MILGITVRSNLDYYFVKKRYLDFFKDFNVIFIYPYNIAHACARCDGFLIPGGADANPNLYKEENYSSHDIVDEIDELDLKVIEYATLNHKPLMGICRGLQMINIFFGGTLKQHILNHTETTHKVMLVEQFLDFPLLEITNSFHHQAVKLLGSRLKGIYYSIDGEVECFVHEKHPIIAVQFHPETDMKNEFYLMFLMYFKNLFSIFKS